MMKRNVPTKVSIEDWDSAAVAQWIASIGYIQYEKRFRDNDISGDVLLNTDLEMLKELKIKSIGHRLYILKAVHKLKLDYGYASELDESFPADQDRDDSPRSSEPWNHTEEVAEKIRDEFKPRDDQLEMMQKQIKQMQADIKQLQEALQSKSQNLIKKAMSPLLSPKRTEPSQKKTSTVHSPVSVTSISTQGAIKVYGHRLSNHENESYKSIMVSVHDPCSSVLKLVMKKWKIDEDWKKYALFMVFNGQEKCLTYSDRPLALLLQKKQGKNEPVFLLKAIRTADSMSIGDGSLIPDRMSHPTSDSSATQITFENADGTVETAVGIFEYKKQRDDELDVNIGDQFIIRDKRTAGWWIVEKDGQAGWVPEGVLMANGASTQNELEQEASAEGIALYDYDAVGGNEMSIKKGDVLIIHKKYQHWFLADSGSAQGWVPSCYVSLNQGGVSPSAPSTPSNLRSPVEDALKSSDELNQSLTNLQQTQSLSQLALSQSMDYLPPSLAPSMDALAAKEEMPEETKRTIDSFQAKVDELQERAASESYTSSSPFNKLDGLMASMNSFMESDPEQQAVEQRKSQIQEIIRTISVDLTNQQPDYLSPSDLQKVTDPAANLMKVVEQIETTEKNYSMILQRLETLKLQKQISAPGSTTNFHSAVHTTCSVLSDVADILLSDKKPLGLSTSAPVNSAADTKPLAQTLASMDNANASRFTKSLRPVTERQSNMQLKPSDSIRRNLASELATKDNQNFVQRSPSSTIKYSSTTATVSDVPSSPGSSASTSAYRVIPYHELIDRKHNDVDPAHLERYLSNEDCLEFLRCTKEELLTMPSWQLNQRKKRAGLFYD